MPPSELEIARVRQSFEKLRPLLEPTSLQFYETLFERAPDLRNLFREDLRAQGMRFMNTLGLILADMEHPDQPSVDYGELGSQTGMYLRKLHQDSDQPVRVAWFPGPESAAWVASGDAGFRKSLKGSPIEIVSTRMGDTGHTTQSRLIELVLDEHADELDYIVGTAVTADAAADVLRRRGLSKEIQVLSYYYSPDVHRGIKRGNIVAAPSDQTVLQARIAVDVMVRMLEKQDYFKHVAPRIVLIDGGRLRGWDSSTTLAPRGFRPIFSINN